MKYLFSGSNFVLFLPDRQSVTTAVGWRCGPCSILYPDCDLSEVIEALRTQAICFNSRQQPDDFEHPQYEAA